MLGGCCHTGDNWLGAAQPPPPRPPPRRGRPRSPCHKYLSIVRFVALVVAFVVVTVEGTGGTNSLAEEVNGIFTMSMLLSIDATPSDEFSPEFS